MDRRSFLKSGLILGGVSVAPMCVFGNDMKEKVEPMRLTVDCDLSHYSDVIIYADTYNKLLSGDVDTIKEVRDLVKTVAVKNVHDIIRIMNDIKTLRQSNPDIDCELTIEDYIVIKSADCMGNDITDILKESDQK